MCACLHQHRHACTVLLGLESFCMSLAHAGPNAADVSCDSHQLNVQPTSVALVPICGSPVICLQAFGYCNPCDVDAFALLFLQGFCMLECLLPAWTVQMWACMVARLCCADTVVTACADGQHEACMLLHCSDCLLYSVSTAVPMPMRMHGANSVCLMLADSCAQRHHLISFVKFSRMDSKQQHANASAVICCLADCH